MQIAVGTLFVVLIGVAPGLGAQKVFEGTITYEVSAGGTPMELVIRTNGHKVRQDMLAPGGAGEMTSYQVIDGESGDITVVIPAARSYMVSNFKKLRAERTDDRDSADARARQQLADLMATGRKETIAGLPCEVYVRESKPGDEWCITTGLGRIAAFDSPTAANPSLAALRPFRDGALVLRATMGSSTGRPMTMVATKVDRVRPSPALFSVPAGFEEMKNPMMPKP